MNSPDVLFISSEFPPTRNPEADHTCRMCMEMAQRGVDVELITTTGVPNVERSKHQFIIHDIMADWGWQEMIKLASIIIRKQPKSIFIMYVGHMYNGHPMICWLPVLIKRKLRRCKIAIQFEGPMIPDPLSNNVKLDQIVIRLLMRFSSYEHIHFLYGAFFCCDAVIVLSEFIRKILPQDNPQIATESLLIPPPPFIPIHQDKALRKYRRELGFKPDEIVLTFFGYLYASKGVEYLFEAAKFVRDAGYDIKIMIIGGVSEFSALKDTHEKYYEYLQRRIKELNIEKHCIWAGAVADHLLSKYIHSSDIVVFPFDNGVYLNNSSLATIAWHKVPIIATASEDTDQIIKDSEAFVLCEPGNSEALAEKIRFLIDNPDEQNQYVERALAFAREVWNWDTAMPRIFEALGLKQN